MSSFNNFGVAFVAIIEQMEYFNSMNIYTKCRETSDLNNLINKLTKICTDFE
jgi:hypothetical protein